MLPILLAFVFVAIILIVVIAGQPDESTVARFATISAPPDTVFPHVNDLHRWEAWSPWAKRDPNATSTFSGADAGAGAAMAWDGNNKVGAGRMTITESRPAGFIRLRLDFLRPMKATNMAEFTFQAAGDQTTVTWSMSAKNNLFFKAFGLLVNCDRMIGRDFEKGLAGLKSVAER